MSHSAIKAIRHLDAGFILAPERYDPRREVAGSEHGRPLTEFAAVVAEQLKTTALSPDTRCRVLDTGDARRGLIPNSKESVDPSKVGSSKKRVRPGDVIISRLRPYLRQVAYVDEALAEQGVVLLCSTEFYVLRSTEEKSIAFLVPFLLSDPVQRALAASQEGGHHPRFTASALTALRLPERSQSRRQEKRPHFRGLSEWA